MKLFEKSLCIMTSVVVLFANQGILNIWTGQERELQKFYRRNYIIILTYRCNAVKKMLDKISFHRHVNFKLTFAFLGHNVFVVCDASIFANNSCPFFELLTFKRSIEAICSHVCLCYSF